MFPQFDESSAMCVVVTPFDKYQRTGLSIRTQACYRLGSSYHIWSVCWLWLCRWALLWWYCGIFDTNWSSHVGKVADVLERLKTNCFTINPPHKCAWAVLKTEWHSHHLMLVAYKSNNSKVVPVLQLTEPTTVHQLWNFIGFINFYKGFWKHSAYTMGLLAELTGLSNSKFW